MTTTIDSKASPLVSEEQSTLLYSKIKILRKAKNVRIGINEVTKVLNDGKAQLVIIAADTVPFEIIQTLPAICEDKNVPFVFCRSATGLGSATEVTKTAAAVIYYNNDNEYKRNDKIIKEMKLTLG
ncbi:ribosomal S6 [Tubulinosema ratisbonensis]|uniref:Ribosomal S6 n=1 Tax=Tubulinosema ratisbonensis TaxID=291195 RepID=A0A437AIQ5_9MICR|nr:ribosomal S6 [Tubulinosema ratisbonensis]